MTYEDGRLSTLTRGYGTSDATTITYTYDAYGNPLSETDGRGNAKTFTYDAYDRLIATLSAEGVRDEILYDANNNRSKTSRTLASGAKATSDVIYNLLDKPTTLTADIDTNTRASISYTYDENDQLLTTTYPNGQVEMRTYDTLDRLIEKKHVGLTEFVTSYTYDPNGNVLTETKNGQTTTFTYDGFDRLLSSRDPSGLQTFLTYDPSGNILSLTRKKSDNTLIDTTTRTYDLLGNLTSVTQ